MKARFPWRERAHDESGSDRGSLQAVELDQERDGADRQHRVPQQVPVRFGTRHGRGDAPRGDFRGGDFGRAGPIHGPRAGRGTGAAERLSPRRVQPGRQPGTRCRCRRTRTPPPPRGPSLERGHELHARDRRHEGAPRDPRHHVRSAHRGARSVRDLSAELSPMMRQYRELKQRYPDYLLLFRLGDFYEMFFEDAHLGARLLQLTLTSRQKGEGAIPMAGIPHHAADGYIARLIRAGRKVAVCEQMEAPAKGKKLVRREVVRVITPGTITDTQFLDGAANNFLLAVHRVPSALGVALVDISTGEFWMGEAATAAAEALLEAALLRRPAEILLTRNADAEWVRRIAAIGLPVTSGEPGWFAPRTARETVAAQFRSASLDGFGVAAMTAGLQAAGGALAYLRDT